MGIGEMGIGEDGVGIGGDGMGISGDDKGIGEDGVGARYLLVSGPLSTCGSPFTHRLRSTSPTPLIELVCNTVSPVVLGRNPTHLIMMSASRDLGFFPSTASPMVSIRAISPTNISTSSR